MYAYEFVKYRRMKVTLFCFPIGVNKTFKSGDVNRIQDLNFIQAGFANVD